MLKVMKFIRANPNWEYELSLEPYCIEVKHDGDYALLKYNQFNSDFSNPIVQECRGLIINIKTMEPVCVPFFKFFNHVEPYAATIDWASAQVQEKIDGSLIKMWFENGWHISTNGTIDAFKAIIGDTNMSFGKLVLDAAKDIHKLFNSLNPNFTYMFELTAPENKVVVDYGPTPQLWYLGRRNNITLQEDNFAISADYINFPKFYNLYSYEDCLKAVEIMGEDEEGFVIVDNDFNRVKIKSFGWLAASKVSNIGINEIIELWKEEKLDDFRGDARIDDFFLRVDEASKSLNEFYKEVEELDNRAVANLKHSYCPYVFSLRAKKVKNAIQWMQKLSRSKLKEILYHKKG